MGGSEWDQGGNLNNDLLLVLLRCSGMLILGDVGLCYVG